MGNSANTSTYINHFLNLFFSIIPDLQISASTVKFKFKQCRIYSHAAAPPHYLLRQKYKERAQVGPCRITQLQHIHSEFIKPHSFKIMTSSLSVQLERHYAFRTVTTPRLGAPRQLGLGNVAPFFRDADESGALDVFSWPLSPPLPPPSPTRPSLRCLSYWAGAWHCHLPHRAWEWDRPVVHISCTAVNGIN